MMSLIINLLGLLNLNKRLLVALSLIIAVVLVVAMFTLSSDVVMAGPATSNSACGTCGG